VTRPPIVDLCLGGVGMALGGLYVWDAADAGFPWYDVLFTLIHVGLAAALFVRSTWRRGSFVLTYALLAAMAALMYEAPINLGVSPAILCAPLALYTVARHDPTPWGATALLFGVAGSFVSPISHLPSGGNRPLIALLIVGMVGTYLWASGRRRTELAYDAQLAQARTAHEQESARRVVQAQVDERARIAREIHDIVAHSLAVVNVQASTALAIGTETQMRDSLTGVRDASKGALNELRSLVTVLRDDSSGTEVAGDLRAVPELIDAARRAGVHIDRDLPGADTLARWQAEWPAAARLAVVRVVQEGLGNVIKHGGPHPHAEVSWQLDGTVCDVVIHNDARLQGESGGFGLVGLRERLTLIGGSLDAGPDDDAGSENSGFRLHARIRTVQEQP